jgi:16S rRNA (guanine527-N7)-methyltransferase
MRKEELSLAIIKGNRDLMHDLRERDIILDNGTLDQITEKFDLFKLNLYYNFLHDYNKIGGFFSASDTERIAERHILESIVYILHLIKEIPVSRETKILDVGTGPGLPGFLFACLKDIPNITLMDSSRRRLSFLEKFIQEENIVLWKKKIQFQYARSEDINGNYPIIISRALIPFPHVAEILTHLQRRGDYVALFSAGLKNSDRDTEYLSHLGYKLGKNMPLEELSFLGNRSLVLLKKFKDTDKGYPRAWKFIKEEMEQWEK